jgi:hypothetical protein
MKSCKALHGVLDLDERLTGVGVNAASVVVAAAVRAAAFSNVGAVDADHNSQWTKRFERYRLGRRVAGPMPLAGTCFQQRHTVFGRGMNDLLATVETSVVIDVQPSSAQ